MELYLIRHADAQPLGEGGNEDDAERPLTAAGHAQCPPLAAALLRHGVHLEHLVTSPLIRARETAEGLLQGLGVSKPELHTCDHLAPGGKRRKLTRFLRGLSAQSVGIVGHRPDLNLYLGWLIGSRQVRIDMAKGGVACVHFDEEIDKGAGVLMWLITQRWCE